MEEIKQALIDFLMSGGKELGILLCSMVPIIELRGAIPLGWATNTPWWLTYRLAVVGNMIPVPFIILFIRRILNWMAGKGGFLKKVSDWVMEHGQKKLEAYKKYEVAGLYLFVAIPLPGTGAWTGALIAALLGMRLKHSVPTIFLGVLTAGLIMLLVSFGIINIAF